MALNDRQPSPPPPPFGNGKIPLIKIKLPKKAAKGEDGKKHMCVACNKNFNSGKALGGHMSSAHVQANKDYSYKKLSSSKRKDPSPDSDSGDSSPCPVCGREFSSQKSLFGHMRCHPNRLWRGMVPPPDLKITDDSANSSSSSSDGAADPGVKELGFHLKKWPTSKRGRVPVSVAPPPPPPPETDEDEDGDDSFAARLKLIKMLSKEDGRPEEVNLKKAEVIMDGKGGKSIVDAETLIGEGVSEELYMSAIHVLMNGKRERERERERGMAMAMEMEMEEEENTSTEKYKCNECSRYFPTHQALGGHRSSHNKFKMNVVNTATRDAAGQPDTPPPALRRKRKEKVNNVKVAKTSTGNAAAAAEASSTGAFAFDLNMAPQDEEAQSSSDA